MLKLVGGGQYRHPAIIQPVTAAFEDPLVVIRAGQAYPPGETREPVHKTMESDRQAGAALCTTGVDYTTAILGAHPGTKTVGPLTLQVTGLVGSLHGTSLSTGCTIKGHTGLARKGAKSTVLMALMSTSLGLNDLATGCG